MLKNLFGKSRTTEKKNPTGKPSRLVIFFADVAGSTHLYETLGDTVGHECVVESLGQISAKITQYNGVAVEVIGDEVMAYFENALDAVNCAGAIWKCTCIIASGR